MLEFLGFFGFAQSQLFKMTNTMKTVLVTGADGFIGSHLTELLVREGYKVKALSQYNSFNYWGWLEDIECRDQIEVLNGDVRDPHYCKHITKDVDIVFHLAALIAIPYSYVAPDSYVDTNIKGTLNICQAAMENGVKRVIHTSTSEVYGTALQFDASLKPYAEYIRNQTDLYNKRQTAYKDDIQALKRILQLAQEELDINRDLQRSNDVSRAEVLRLERGVADIQAQIANKRNKYFQDAQAEMTKAQEDLSSQTEQLRDRTQVLEHTELTAPMDGVVNSVKVTTLGGVVKPGETVIELLPSGDKLIVEAKVPPADMAFIALEQDASIKLDAYDAAIFGGLRGRVDYISAEALYAEKANPGVPVSPSNPPIYYTVRLRITGTEFKGAKAQEIKLRPGLTATAEIKALERSVLSYLTKPITKTFGQAMGER